MLLSNSRNLLIWYLTSLICRYLTELAEDEQEYLSYFWWREHYNFVDSSTIWRASFCRLCEMLNQETIVHGHY